MPQKRTHFFPRGTKCFSFTFPNSTLFQQSATWMRITRLPIETSRLRIEFNDWYLHRIGRCSPLNLPLWDLCLLYWLISRRDVFELFCRWCKWWHNSHRYLHCGSVLTVMSVLAMDIVLVLQEFLRIVPSTIPFEAAPLLSYIGDFLFKNSPHYSARISRRIRIIKSIA